MSAELNKEIEAAKQLLKDNDLVVYSQEEYSFALDKASKTSLKDEYGRAINDSATNTGKFIYDKTGIEKKEGESVKDYIHRAFDEKDNKYNELNNTIEEFKSSTGEGNINEKIQKLREEHLKQAKEIEAKYKKQIEDMNQFSSAKELEYQNTINEQSQRISYNEKLKYAEKIIDQVKSQYPIEIEDFKSMGDEFFKQMKKEIMEDPYCLVKETDKEGEFDLFFVDKDGEKRTHKNQSTYFTATHELLERAESTVGKLVNYKTGINIKTQVNKEGKKIDLDLQNANIQSKTELMNHLVKYFQTLPEFNGKHKSVIERLPEYKKAYSESKKQLNFI